MLINLENSQQNAVDAIVAWFAEQKTSRFILSGYAGTGKSTILPFIIKALQLEIHSGAVAFATFTGKASLVLKRKGLPATTIHQLMYEAVRQPDDTVYFIKRATLPENIKLIVIDEASMVSEQMVLDLESYNVPILYTGDNFQLPPVGDPNDALMANPTYQLTKIHRQAEGNPIIKIASMTRLGEKLSFGSFGQGVLKLRESDFQKERYSEFDQILCGTNATRRALNSQLREAHSREGQYPVKGDKVICLKNDWRKGLVNGLIGFVARSGNLVQNNFGSTIKQFEIVTEENERFKFLDIEPEIFETTESVTWRKGIQQFDFGYAITVHKAQGSQYDRVLVHEEQFMGDTMHARWLYTAITRAVKSLTIIAPGPPKIDPSIRGARFKIAK